jgi:hypothetical protein
MKPTKQLYLHLRCVVIDIKESEFYKIPFHAKGIWRALNSI